MTEKVYATEQQFQADCVSWFNYEFPSERKSLHCNNNNSADRRSGNVAKAMGVVKGVADLELLIFGGVAFIELKLPGKTQSEDQIKFEQLCISKRILYFVVETLEQFKKLVCELLSGK